MTPGLPGAGTLDTTSDLQGAAAAAAAASIWQHTARPAAGGEALAPAWLESQLQGAPLAVAAWPRLDHAFRTSCFPRNETETGVNYLYGDNIQQDQVDIWYPGVCGGPLSSGNLGCRDPAASLAPVCSS